MNLKGIEELACSLLRLVDEVHELRVENARLRRVEQEHLDNLLSGIQHGEHMMAGLLELAMKPGVLEAVSVANKTQEA